MQKLTQAILDAQAKLKISQSELSRRLGKGRNYLGNIQDGCSTAKQLEIIDMINRVVAGEVFKSDDEIIKELSEKLESAQQLAKHNHDCAHKYLNQVHECKAEINKLKLIVNDTDESYNALHQSHANKQILLNQSEENTLYWMAKVPTTRWVAFKLFIKLMFGGKA